MILLDVETSKANQPPPILQNRWFNCFVCLIEFYRKTLYPFQPLKGYCEHLQPNFIGKPYFKISKIILYLIHPMVILSILTITPLLKIYTICKELSVICIIYIDCVITIFLTWIVLICMVLNINYRLKELNGLANIFKNRKFYGINDIFNASTEKTLVLNQNFVFIFSIGGVFLSITLTYFFRRNEPYSYQRYIIWVCGSVQLVVLLMMRQKLMIMTNLYNITSKCLLKTFERYRGNSEYPHRKEFGNILHLYLELRKHNNSSNDFYNPMIGFWMGVGVLATTFSIYSTIRFIRDGNFENWDHSVMRISTSLVALNYIVTIVQKFTNQNDETLYFIFKYPISRLNEEEAFQVEMLIRTLIYQKPVLRASDLFTVNTGLIASVSGTLLTYVLVALQFQPAWDEDLSQ